MNAREAIAEVLRGVGFWGTHSDRWNDTEWQDRYWLTLADALLASDVLGRVRDEGAAEGWDAGHRHACLYVERLCRQVGDLDANPYRTTSDALRGSGRSGSARVDSGAGGDAVGRSGSIQVEGEA